jgi:hypothetical protein
MVQETYDLHTRIRDACAASNEELVEAGVLVAGEGLKPSSEGKRVRIAGDRTVTDGPFENTEALVLGFWVWRVESMDAAIAWAERCPPPMHGEATELELRPLYEMEDFGDEMTPELRTQEEKLRRR